MKDYSNDFQTPPPVCRYMVSLIPDHVHTVLEPTKGIGNIVRELGAYQVTAPDDYFLLDKSLRFDCVVMNPPFSGNSAILTNAPANFKEKGMKVGYRILFDCMHKSDNVIALMPWFTISDSDVRRRFIRQYGLVSITTLPRSTFEYTRIQTCILQLKKGYTGPTEFRDFEALPTVLSKEEKAQMLMQFN
jgi:type I restriction-modification system DNA methylase subunit